MSHRFSALVGGAFPLEFAEVDAEDRCSLAILNPLDRMDDYSDFFFADDGDWFGVTL